MVHITAAVQRNAEVAMHRSPVSNRSALCGRCSPLWFSYSCPDAANFHNGGLCLGKNIQSRARAKTPRPIAFACPVGEHGLAGNGSLGR